MGENLLQNMSIINICRKDCVGRMHNDYINLYYDFLLKQFFNNLMLVDCQ